MNQGIKTALKIGVFLAMCGCTTVHADDFDQLKATTPAQRAAAQTAYMKSHLTLTDAQIPKISAVNQKYAEQMEPVIKGTEGGLGKMLKARDIQKNKDAELRNILTPAQFENLESKMDEMREEVKHALLKN